MARAPGLPGIPGMPGLPGIPGLLRPGIPGLVGGGIPQKTKIKPNANMKPLYWNMIDPKKIQNTAWGMVNKLH